MNLQSILLAGTGVTLCLPLALAQQGRLSKVDPLDAVQADEEPGEPFDVQGWRNALQQSDLQLRERDYDRLLRLALRDDDAWDFLQEVSRDTDQPELAWTARLALRELDRTSHHTSFPPLANPGVKLSDPFASLEELLESMGVGPTLQLRGQARPRALQRGGLEKEQSRSVSIQNNGHEWRVEIHERVEGEETTREYTGESLEAILEENPELSEDLGVSHLGGIPDGFRMELGLPLEAPLQDFFEGFQGFRHLQPLQTFEWQGPGGGQKPRSMRFFLAPQAMSRPLRTDVLGVRVAPVSSEYAAELGMDQTRTGGLFVQASYPGTIAHLLGVGHGDVLLELDGNPLGSADDITDWMSERPEDRPVELAWIDTAGVHQRKTWKPDKRQRSF